MLNGIDVSNYQGEIDWNAVRPHIDFAIIKAGGYGTMVDSEFARNRNECLGLGIPHGFYYFAGGGDPVQEADHFYSIVGSLHTAEIVVLDFEIDHEDPQGYCLAFLQRAEQLFGVKPYLYISAGRCAGMDALTGYPLWMAGYFDNTPDHPEQYNPAPWSSWSIWQYSSTGSVPGIDGNIDMNVATGWESVPTKPIQEDDDMGIIRMESATGKGKWWTGYVSADKKTSLRILSHVAEEKLEEPIKDACYVRIILAPLTDKQGVLPGGEFGFPVGDAWERELSGFSGKIAVEVNKANAVVCYLVEK